MLMVRDFLVDSEDKLIKFVDSIRFMLKSVSGYYFVKDLNSHYVELSQSIENHLGIKIKKLVGKSDYETPWEDFAEQYRRCDLQAISTEQSDVFEPLPLSKNVVLSVRCLRLPIYDDTNRVVGVFGQTDVLSMNRNLREALKALNDVDKKRSSAGSHTLYQIDHYNKNLQLTQREAECLFLLVRGKTAKEIALFLEISTRTIESYIESIKNKMGVSTRSEIIATAIEQGMLEIIPKQGILPSFYNRSDKWKDIFS